MKQVFIIFIIALISSCQVYAQKTEYKAGDVIQISQKDTLHSDLISANNFLNINGYIKGDLFTASRNFTLNGKVQNDIIAAGQNIQINGISGDKLIAFAGNIVITGKIKGDAIIFGDHVVIKPGAHIYGNLYIGSGSLKMEGGRVDGWIRGGSGTAYLDGKVGNYVDLSTEHIKFGTNYKAVGKTHLELYNEINTHEIPNAPSNLTITIKRGNELIKPIFLIWSLFAMFVTGVVLLFLFEDTFFRLLDDAEQNLIKYTGVGLLAVILGPVLFIALILLLVTLPLAFTLIFLYLIILYFSWIISALYLGKYLLSNIRTNKEVNHLYLSLLIGTIIVFFLTNLPFIGWIFSIGFLAFGTGSILEYIWNNRYQSE